MGTNNVYIAMLLMISKLIEAHLLFQYSFLKHKCYKVKKIITYSYDFEVGTALRAQAILLDSITWQFRTEKRKKIQKANFLSN